MEFEFDKSEVNGLYTAFIAKKNSRKLTDFKSQPSINEFILSKIRNQSFLGYKWGSFEDVKSPDLLLGIFSNTLLQYFGEGEFVLFEVKRINFGDFVSSGFLVVKLEPQNDSIYFDESKEIKHLPGRYIHFSQSFLFINA